MGGLQHWAEMAWLLLGLTIEPLVGTGWAIFLLLFMNGLRKWSSGHVGPPFLAVEALFSVYRGDHWPRSVTIESSLKSGCNLRHESV